MPKSISKIPKESSFKDQLQDILNNRTDGAGHIEKATSDLITFILDSHNPNSKDLVIDSITMIRDRFPAMANILNLADFVLNNISFSEIGIFESLLKDYISISKTLKEITIITCGEKIGNFNTIFTLSNSSLVRESILYAASRGWKGKVMIVESRPFNEGTILAIKLAEKNIKVELAVDMLMSRMIDKSDTVFIGADTITPSFFINKIGSQNAVDCALNLGKPCYVAGDKTKIISDHGFDMKETDKPAGEISEKSSKFLTIYNPYFEKVQPEGDFHYICGSGLFKPAEIRNLLR